MTMQYHMPAEWEGHSSTWIAWPHRESDWPGKFEPIGPVYAEIVRLLAPSEPVHILVFNEGQRETAAQLCLSYGIAENIHFHLCPTDRSWLRDSGPIIVRDEKQQPVALDWHFNAWAKYHDWHHDDLVPRFIAQQLRLPLVQPFHQSRRVVLEGGSIDVNGCGALLTTEECLLSNVQERNPGFSRADYEELFAHYLGVQEVLWLERGIVGDDTHGHIDDIARFTSAKVIAVAVEANRHDENHEILSVNRQRLRAWESRFTLVEIPMPRAVYFEGQRLPASYLNFYVANRTVLVPTFNDPHDRIALNILAELFPERDVVGVHCVDLILGLGTLHCLTQQIIA